MQSIIPTRDIVKRYRMCTAYKGIMSDSESIGGVSNV